MTSPSRTQVLSNAVHLLQIMTAPVGIGPRQRPQQHGVDDAEDRGVGADAERQREDRHRGEARIARERAGAETQILSEKRRMAMVRA